MLWAVSAIAFYILLGLGCLCGILSVLCGRSGDDDGSSVAGTFMVFFLRTACAISMIYIAISGWAYVFPA